MWMVVSVAEMIRMLRMPRTLPNVNGNVSFVWWWRFSCVWCVPVSLWFYSHWRIPLRVAPITINIICIINNSNMHRPASRRLTPTIGMYLYTITVIAASYHYTSRITTYFILFFFGKGMSVCEGCVLSVLIQCFIDKWFSITHEEKVQKKNKKLFFKETENTK